MAGIIKMHTTNIDPFNLRHLYSREFLKEKCAVSLVPGVVVQQQRNQL